jgi:hypothetical protein
MVWPTTVVSIFSNDSGQALKCTNYGLDLIDIQKQLILSWWLHQLLSPRVLQKDRQFS